MTTDELSRERIRLWTSTFSAVLLSNVNENDVGTAIELANLAIAGFDKQFPSEKQIDGAKK